jgi:hypothetical protein
VITRFRFEAEDQNEENVEEALNEEVAAVLDRFQAYDDGSWVQTDKIIVPMRDEDGNAVMYGRVVYKRESNG